MKSITFFLILLAMIAASCSEKSPQENKFNGDCVQRNLANNWVVSLKLVDKDVGYHPYEIVWTKFPDSAVIYNVFSDFKDKCVPNSLNSIFIHSSQRDIWVDFYDYRSNLPLCDSNYSDFDYAEIGSIKIEDLQNANNGYLFFEAPIELDSVARLIFGNRN